MDGEGLQIILRKKYGEGKSLMGSPEQEQSQESRFGDAADALLRAINKGDRDAFRTALAQAFTVWEAESDIREDQAKAEGIGSLSKAEKYGVGDE